MAARREQSPPSSLQGLEQLHRPPKPHVLGLFPQQLLVTSDNTKAETLPGKQGGDRHRERTGHPRRGSRGTARPWAARAQGRNPPTALSENQGPLRLEIFTRRGGKG